MFDEASSPPPPPPPPGAPPPPPGAPPPPAVGETYSMLTEDGLGSNLFRAPPLPPPSCITIPTGLKLARNVRPFPPSSSPSSSKVPVLKFGSTPKRQSETELQLPQLLESQEVPIRGT